MRIGVPKEIKDQEYRVGMTPGSVKELVSRGHSVLVQTQAGAAIGFLDDIYQSAGAEIVFSAEQIYSSADMVVKVKEPQLSECQQMRPGQILFTYLHLAADSKQTDLLMKSGCIAFAYETITDDQGGLPLLTPSSEVAGCMAVQAGAHYLEKAQGGRGILLGGVPGVAPAKVVVLGAGVSGTQALRTAIGLGAEVTVLDKSLKRLRELDLVFDRKRVTFCYANTESIELYSTAADLVIGAVLVPGAAAPKLISRAVLKKMRPGSVIVDLAIDQGGCFETSRPTSHSHPVYVEEGIIHYCVTNMPGSVPYTSTIALNNATLPFIIELAEKNYRKACLDNKHLKQGLNIGKGQITYPAVALALGKQCVSVDSILKESE